MGSNTLPTILMILVGLAICLLVFIFFVELFRFVWNRIVPEVFGLKVITFWQAVGIWVLAFLLFAPLRLTMVNG